MMDRMADSYIQVGHRWVIPQAKEIDWRCKVLAGQPIQKRHTLGETILVPLSNVGTGFHRRWHGCGFSKVSMNDSVQKPNLRVCKMASQFQCTHRLCIR